MSAQAKQRNPIDARLQQAVADKRVAGVAAIAVDRKHILYRGAFGVADVATSRPLDTHALFRIASMTKAITSTAAMQLVEAGKFGLDDPVAGYLPALASSIFLYRSQGRFARNSIAAAQPATAARNSEISTL
jgi:methyl acetate hydrolase